MTDITKHEWSDESIDCIPDEDEGGPFLNLGNKYGDPGVFIERDDAIAIARHFNLIPSEKDQCQLDELNARLHGLNNIESKE